MITVRLEQRLPAHRRVGNTSAQADERATSKARATCPVTRKCWSHGLSCLVKLAPAIGGPGANRTRDTRFRRAVLYPLSYEASDHECTDAAPATASAYP